ncbi:response regulator [Idiomarina seosinensis]|uniref:response regulator n=1 Tax=Idiomarina seosinensis TaxID=281739 RepID=UPI0038506AC0
MSNNNRSTVLVADDDMISLEVFKIMLKQFDVDVLTATSGAEALDALSANPDLIFLDYEMPDMSGAEVCRQVRQQQAFSQTPVIAVTSHQSATEMDDCRRAGMNATLHKPVAPDALAELLAEYTD